MSNGFAGKQVVITGASRGIGLEFARRYAERKWRVIATCRNPDTAEALQKSGDLLGPLSRGVIDAARRHATLADLLWAAGGVNRAELGGRTAPSAMNAQEVLLYAAMPHGLYLYEPAAHELRRVAASDVRGVTGYQDVSGFFAL